MAEEYSIEILVRVLNRVLMPGVQITEEHVTLLVKYVTGIPGKMIFYSGNKIYLPKACTLSPDEFFSLEM